MFDLSPSIQVSEGYAFDCCGPMIMSIMFMLVKWFTK